VSERVGGGGGGGGGGFGGGDDGGGGVGHVTVGLAFAKVLRRLQVGGAGMATFLLLLFLTLICFLCTSYTYPFI
jgi:hypothetical protein